MKLNIELPMLDQDFCEFLEYELCKALKNSADERTRGFWCDGVLLSEPDSHYEQKFVNDNRQVILKAFVGFDGQSEYRLIMNFGGKSLSKYARGLDIKDCILEASLKQRFDINMDERIIVMQLS